MRVSCPAAGVLLFTLHVSDVSALRAWHQCPPATLRRRCARSGALRLCGEPNDGSPLKKPASMVTIDKALQRDDVSPQLGAASRPSLRRGVDGLDKLRYDELEMLEERDELDFAATDVERDLLRRSLESLDYSGNWSDATQMRDSIVLCCVAPEVRAPPAAALGVGPRPCPCLQPTASLPRCCREQVLEGEYTCPYDEFTAERVQLHERVLDTMMTKHTMALGVQKAATGTPTAAAADTLQKALLETQEEQHIFIVVGVPGSGKDSILKRYLRGLDLPGLPLLDASADLVKEYLAEYANDELSVAVREHNAEHGPGKHLLHAQFLHRESVLLIDVLIERAMEERRSIMLEKTLFDAAHVLAYARRLRERGCRVHLLGTHITPLKNWEFLSARMASGQTFGRSISKEQVISSLRQYHSNLQLILASPDDRTMFDT